MDRIIITGGEPLNGTIPISGAKNAALPLMIASLLTDKPLVLKNIPRLADVSSLLRILTHLGVDHCISGRRTGETTETGQTITLTASSIIDRNAPYNLVRTMRASFWVIAPLLARFGEARVSMPGGCAIGTRPIDLLLMALENLGASITIEEGDVVVKAPHGLKGNEIIFPKVTVGGTHIALMAASLAQGTTVIRNAAQEPEIKDLADCLVKMGAHIEGAGTSTIEIQGVSSLKGAEHVVLPDRIETGTYAFAVAMTGGDVLLEDTSSSLLQSALDVLAQTDTHITQTERGIHIYKEKKAIRPVDITTEPFPGFPTDLQAQFMALMVCARGTSRIRETIFENRFMHVQELARLGAKITLNGDEALIEGVGGLNGAPVMATDLRASASLLIAGLVAKGETVINRVYHLDRGFEAIENKLNRCGAKVERYRD